MLRQFTTPKWWVRYALLVVSLAALTRIGLWQWHRARDGGSWVNYGYAVQWWLFTGFAVFLFVKLVLDELDPSRVEDRSKTDEAPLVLAAPRVAAPVRQAADDLDNMDDMDDADDELAAYNRRLLELHEASVAEGIRR